MELDGKTPSEVAGIKVEGDNKWITLIQNASRKALFFMFWAQAYSILFP